MATLVDPALSGAFLTNVSWASTSSCRKFENNKERFTLLGVTSGGVGCGGLPDFYTYVAHSKVWWIFVLSKVVIPDYTIWV